MFRRLVLWGFLLVLAAAFMVRRGNLAGTIRSMESLVRPVFHKGTINHYAGIYKEDPLFVTALIKVESNFVRKAKSHRGAVGLMQIMPKTGEEMAKELKMKPFKPEDLEDPEVNIRLGFHYLSKLRKEFGNDEILILSAYNAGQANVKAWLKKNKKKTLALEEIEFHETRNFAQEVLSTYGWLKKFQKLRNKIFKSAKNISVDPDLKK